jgi:hypothetical protein
MRFALRGAIHAFGECRNMNDHRGTASVNVTEQVATQ